MKTAIFDANKNLLGVFDTENHEEAVYLLNEEVWLLPTVEQSLKSNWMLRLVPVDNGFSSECPTIPNGGSVFTAEKVVNILRAAGIDILLAEEEAHAVFYEDCTIPDDLDD